MIKTITVSEFCHHYQEQLEDIFAQLDIINDKGLNFILSFKDSILLEVNDEKLRIISNEPS